MFPGKQAPIHVHPDGGAKRRKVGRGVVRLAPNDPGKRRPVSKRRSDLCLHVPSHSLLMCLQQEIVCRCTRDNKASRNDCFPCCLCPDKLCFPLQHREDSHDQTESLDHLWNHTVQVSQCRLYGVILGWKVTQHFAIHWSFVLTFCNWWNSSNLYFENYVKSKTKRAVLKHRYT